MGAKDLDSIMIDTKANIIKTITTSVRSAIRYCIEYRLKVKISNIFTVA